MVGDAEVEKGETQGDGDVSSGERRGTRGWREISVEGSRERKMPMTRLPILS